MANILKNKKNITLNKFGNFNKKMCQLQKAIDTFINFQID
ncbi:hypothetical protein SAMN05443663_11360 [Flavobacterium defluvii]|uniref:Uncharacterized protein n=1 Tax=Flavobacterium defluvii TaxID=370979 RepID=A0A1M5WBE1_9FLAO|nr:hypothetical protein SAMN05443663_11360 [Flavobacterium defluvii]